MKKKDIIFICAILALSALLFAIFYLVRGNGAYAVVKIDGKELARYSLASDGEYTLNNGTNTLVIKDGSASLHSSDCPDKLCEKRGKISRTGETITCLPNKLTVTVYGSGANDVELVG